MHVQLTHSPLFRQFHAPKLPSHQLNRIESVAITLDWGEVNVVHLTKNIKVQ